MEERKVIRIFLNVAQYVDEWLVYYLRFDRFVHLRGVRREAQPMEDLDRHQHGFKVARTGLVQACQQGKGSDQVVRVRVLYRQIEEDLNWKEREKE